MIPNFKDYFYPFMLCLSDDKFHTIREIRESIALYFSLTQEDLREKTKSGNLRHNDRVSWTSTYLKKMKLITYSKTGGYKIMPEGMRIFHEKGEEFDLNTVRDLEGFQRLQRKEETQSGFWVPGHWTSTGRYIAGYVSNWEYKGRQRRFTKEELEAFYQAKELEKSKRKHSKYKYE